MKSIGEIIKNQDQPSRESFEEQYYAPPQPVLDYEWNDMGNQSLKRMKEDSVAIAREISTNLSNGSGKPRAFAYVGASNTGKSYTARKILEYVRRFVPPDRCYFCRLNSLLRQLREGSSEGRANLRDAMQRKVVVLDDLGAGHETSYSVSIYVEIMDAREGKWTILTSNLKPGEIATKLDQRIAARILRHGGRFIFNDANDYFLNLNS